jgi:hypothetical protein
MKHVAWLPLALFLLATPLWTACNGDDDGTPSPQTGETVAAADLSPEELGTLGAEIDREPERAAEILEERGLDPDEFAEAVRAVAADVGDSKDYAKAFGEARETPEAETPES